jgi:hypothetical protein
MLLAFFAKQKINVLAVIVDVPLFGKWYLVANAHASSCKVQFETLS